MAERPQDLQVIDAFTAALREVDASAAISRDLAAFYAAHGLEGATLTAMVERGASRLKMYRAMVQGRLRRVIREFIPRTAARLGRPRYDADFAAFFAEAGSHSVVLRDVPVELVTWAAPRWRADPEIPDYLVDLARHELVAAEVRNAPGGREPPTGEALALGRPLAFDGTTRLQRYDHAVHRLPQEEDDRSEPAAEASALLVYRDRESYRVRYIELTPRASEVLARLLAGATVVAALQEGAAAAGEALDDDFLVGMTHLFADLSERGVILGAAVG
ncbi:MAG: putative DNA-binding domain-containing protein [Myxococcales bacterium]|nr:putative DNA-binding domain-containing protein [Myxococcales bacterium]MCB9704730.1 putative DNA-binding domain-containing protein [Myxococcales bacterium]